MKKLFRKSIQLPTRVDAPLPHAITSNALRVEMQPKYTVPAVPHPSPYHRIAILPSKSGLLLRPAAPGPAPTKHIRVAWGDGVEIQEVAGAGESDDDWSSSATVYGILGVLKLFSGSFLLVITSVTEVGEFLDPRYLVYGIKAVAAIPLTQPKAQTIVNSIAIRFKSASLIPALDQSVADGSVELVEPPEGKVKFLDDDDIKIVSPRTTNFDNSPPTSAISSGASTPVSESDVVTPLAKVLSSRLSFWNRSPSRKVGSSISEEVEALHDSIQDKEPEEIVQDIVSTTAPGPASEGERRRELDDKILKGCIKEFTKGEMYFAYDFDVTTALQHKQQEIKRQRRKDNPQGRRAVSASSNGEDEETVDVLAEPNGSLPLWRRVTKQFWWNESILQPFIEAGLHSYVLPVMQGFFQIATFEVPRVPEANEMGDRATVDYIVISRRSRDRAGLRYQRRGIDDDANVANFVETEAITRVDREGTTNVFSYLQIRGSVPLFWTQSGYSLKPPPLLSTDRTHSQNLDALRRHFSKTIPRYGAHMIVNLAEQQGKEGAITHAYREYVHELGSKDMRYTDYDFHAETKGMKYENISKLIEKMQKTFENQGFTWFSGNRLLSDQRAVFRVNCIDCLDRTNVVQSAFARNVLNKQLGVVALWNPMDSSRSDIDIVFNDVWANNGDAISKAYAGTSALKGDFTRTGKRDLGGMLNDGMNSLARMYSSTFGDWFSQAVIDFILGYRTLSVFSEFLLKLQSTDPRERIRLYNIRAEAIATSVSRVLSEGERLLSGWTLLSPSELCTTISDTFEEKVVLLSVHAFYVVSYDYSLEKVTRYTRIPLGQIVGIKKGAYILSPLEEGSRDPIQNYGFQVSYLSSGESTRLTSYSLRNTVTNGGQDLVESPPPSGTREQLQRRSSSKLSMLLAGASSDRGDRTSFVAFKAFPIDPARARRTTGSFEETADDLSWAKTCKEAVDMIVSSIHQACTDAGVLGEKLVTQGDVVSLMEAQKSTTVIAKMEYGVKRLLWLGG